MSILCGSRWPRSASNKGAKLKDASKDGDVPYATRWFENGVQKEVIGAVDEVTNGVMMVALNSFLRMRMPPRLRMVGAQFFLSSEPTRTLVLQIRPTESFQLPCAQRG